jgi:hypothetical protein
MPTSASSSVVVSECVNPSARETERDRRDMKNLLINVIGSRNIVTKRWKYR